MKKLLLSIISCFTILLCVTVVSMNKYMIMSNADTQTYKMHMDYERNRLHEDVDLRTGDTILKTDLGGEVLFTYHYTKSDSKNWCILGKSGLIKNYHPINGLTQIVIVANLGDGGSYEIAYSQDDSLSNTRVCYTGTSWDFNGTLPNYFQISNLEDSEVTIKSIILTYTCVPQKYSLTVSSNDVTKGTVLSNYNELEYNERAVVAASAIDDNHFMGWFSDPTYCNILSHETVYAFSMPQKDYQLYAKFLSDEEYTIYSEKNAIIPIVVDSNTIKYGIYPQTVLNDNESSENNDIELINTLNSLDESYLNKASGWYLYEDSFYCKKVATQTYSLYYFNNGNKVVPNETYWFKCEPIEWRVLSTTATIGYHYVVSEILLDVRQYSKTLENRLDEINYDVIYPNNYEYSDIRAWLNGYDGSTYEAGNYTGVGFLNSAFMLGSSYIDKTFVDNSARTTNNENNEYASNTTEDKIFSPSYKDYVNSSYGFNEAPGEANDARHGYTSDYCRAMGALCETSEHFGAKINNGTYWTRSPQYDMQNIATYCSTSGVLNYVSSDVTNKEMCVRPAMNLKLD